MELELKHLAPYLPYGLKLLNIQNDLIFELETDFLSYTIKNREVYKLVLRPLSYLTKDIEHNGEKFVPIDYFEIGDDNNETYEYDNGNIRLIQDLEYLSVNRFSLDIVFIPYGVIQKLLEWKFDIFGLIEAGLAIDINTLDQH